MPIKDFPAGLTTLLNTGWVRSHPALDITLDDDSVLHYSTIPIAFETDTYTDRLAKVNTVKASLGRAVDRAEVVLDNSDLAVGDLLLDVDADELLDNAKAVLHWIYVNVWDSSEIYRVTRLSGLLYTFSEDNSTELNLTIISDAYAGGGVAQFEVKPFCVWKYKDGINCDYAGALPTCDFSYDGVNGCVAHFGTEMAKARFGGGAVDITETAVIDYGQWDVGSGGGGGGINDGLCFLAGTPLYVNEQYDSLPIQYINSAPGGSILGVERSTLNPVPDVQARPVIVGDTRHWFELVFSDGAILNVTPSHPFYPMPGERVRVRDFNVGMPFRRNVLGKWRTVKLIRMTQRTSLDPVPVFNQPVAGTRGYWANGFPVSNRKNDDGELPYRSFDTTTYNY
jgi:hypothetical protein